MKDTEVEACFQGEKGMNISYITTMCQILLFAFLPNYFSHLVFIILWILGIYPFFYKIKGNNLSEVKYLAWNGIKNVSFYSKVHIISTIYHIPLYIFLIIHLPWEDKKNPYEVVSWFSFYFK